LRYLNVSDEVFVDDRGRRLTVKGLREFAPGIADYVVDRGEEEPFDLIASRDDVYGEGGERRAYELHDAMAVELVDRRFDYSIIRRVRVP
jgi:hypothetical protein